MKFDIIGDVHGCADKLDGLLKSLGYRKRGGAFRQAGHQAVFVGDLIDRGLQQVETLEIVRPMVDAGTARVTMGNHEFNAISFVTPNPEIPGDFMRPRAGPKGAKNRKQHSAFLEQVGEGSALHVQYVEWFRTWPLWLELDGLRITHACWHRDSLEVLRSMLEGEPTMSEEFVIAANTRGTDAYWAVETVLKGPEFELGKYGAFVDKEDYLRTAARIRWWDPKAMTLRSIAEIPAHSKTPEGLNFPELPDEPCAEADQYRYQDSTPVFFGHYWFTGTPQLAGPTTVCLDYSAVRGGPLVAYRWDGEETLLNENLLTFS